MAGTHRKGTNDADGNGAKGGSRPEADDDRLTKLEAEVDALKALMRCNGWTVPKGKRDGA